MTSTGDYTMEILVPLGNKENSDDLCGELRMRIFNPLGSNENFGDFTGELRMRIFTLLKNKKTVWGRRLTAGE